MILWEQNESEANVEAIASKIKNMDANTSYTDQQKEFDEWEQMQKKRGIYPTDNKFWRLISANASEEDLNKITKSITDGISLATGFFSGLGNGVKMMYDSIMNSIKGKKDNFNSQKKPKNKSPKNFQSKYQKNKKSSRKPSSSNSNGASHKVSNMKPQRPQKREEDYGNLVNHKKYNPKYFLPFPVEQERLNFESVSGHSG